MYQIILGSVQTNTILGSGLAPVTSANSRSETAWERPLGNWPQRGFTGCSSVPDLYLLPGCLSVCEFYMFICTKSVTFVGMSVCMWVLYVHLQQICKIAKFVCPSSVHQVDQIEVAKDFSSTQNKSNFFDRKTIKPHIVLYPPVVCGCHDVSV